MPRLDRSVKGVREKEQLSGTIPGHPWVAGNPPDAPEEKADKELSRIRFPGRGW